MLKVVSLGIDEAAASNAGSHLSLGTHQLGDPIWISVILPKDQIVPGSQASLSA